MNCETLRATASRRPDGAVVLSVRGELDIATSTALRDLVFTARVHYGAHLTLDLSGVTFCDMTGLRALRDCGHDAESTGGTLALTALPEQLTRLLAISDLTRASVRS